MASHLSTNKIQFYAKRGGKFASYEEDYTYSGLGLSGGEPLGSDKQPLGDILIQSGLIGPTELGRALAAQKATGGRLGEILVAMGYLTEADVARCVANQLGIPFVPDHELQVDLNVARLMPVSAARKTSALPLREEAGLLLVAMADPLDVFSQDEIRHLTRRPIQLVACTRHGIARAIAQYERLSALGQRESLVDLAAVASLPPNPNDGPIVTLVNEMINLAVEVRASDIHVEPSEERLRIRMRVDGFLREGATYDMRDHPAILARIKVLAGLDIAERRNPQDGRIELREKGRNLDLRVSTLPTVSGEKAVLRLFDKSRALPRLEELGFGPQILDWYKACAGRPYGMLLVTGPTGSGKTTTLMSTLAYLNAVEQNIVTIEDPVEYQLAGVNHVQVHAKTGLTFAEGLRAVLRQDPNIIMVGEVRDSETADVAIRSALTGHLVLSTLHTNDAAGALTRLVDMEVEPYLIASSVMGILAQRLVRRLCHHCRELYRVPAEPYVAVGCTVADGEVATLYRAPGCSRCNGTGYQGRFPIFEFLRVTPTIQDLVIQRAPVSDIRGQAVTEGMSLLVTNGLQRALEGLTTPEEVFRVATFMEQ